MVSLYGGNIEDRYLCVWKQEGQSTPAHTEAY